MASELTARELWKAFCKRDKCQYYRPQPDMGGKNCMAHHGNFRNESGMLSYETCPIVKQALDGKEGK